MMTKLHLIIAKVLLLSVVLATSTLSAPVNSTPEPTTSQALEETIPSAVSPTPEAPATNAIEETQEPSLSEQAEDLRKNALSTGNSAYLLYDYVVS